MFCFIRQRPCLLKKLAYYPCRTPVSPRPLPFRFPRIDRMVSTGYRGNFSIQASFPSIPSGGSKSAPCGPAHSHTTPSPSRSFMNSYAGCPRRTGAILWARASAQVIRPFPLSSYRARASTSGPGVGVAVATDLPSSSTTISVDSHPASTPSMASASARSMVSPYSRRTSTTRSTYQHSFRSGSHSATSLSLFW